MHRLEIRTCAQWMTVFHASVAPPIGLASCAWTEKRVPGCRLAILLVYSLLPDNPTVETWEKCCSTFSRLLGCYHVVSQEIQGRLNSRRLNSLDTSAMTLGARECVNVCGHTVMRVHAWARTRGCLCVLCPCVRCACAACLRVVCGGVQICLRSNAVVCLG